MVSQVKTVFQIKVQAQSSIVEAEFQPLSLK